MKKLTIVVPHYKEPFEICKFLFDSIELQHGVDKSDFDVLVVNDGDDVVWDESVFEPYHYEINYAVKPHGGLSDTRNYGIENGDSEYVMFCDCDDGFLNNYAIHLILSAIQNGFDFLHSVFIEEQPNFEVEGGWRIFRREKDLVFVHGKVYRRQFLKDKNIRFDTDLYLNEDSVFNKIAFHESDNTRYVETPFYLWAWNEGSTVRRDKEDFILKTYDQVLLMRERICEGLEKRGFINEYFDSVCKTIMDSFYDFQEPSFVKPENKELRLRAEKLFKKFYQKFSKAFMECDSARIGKAMMESRLIAFNAGMMMETTDLKTWLKHIKNDVKI